MRTETRSIILRIIKEAGGASPIELVRLLGFSAQAIHRHLRALVASGALERRGRGPLTRYRIAGPADLERALRWYTSLQRPAESPGEFICETRDVFSARLARLGPQLSPRLSPEELSLVIAAAAEVGNNSFDHNLGQWRDDPGCWLESQISGGRLRICIADRGQGVFRSLSRVDPSLQDEQAALRAAFEKRISGRAPEKRGNGLKFVKNVIGESGKRGLACRSGAASVSYGGLEAACTGALSGFSSQSGGTVTLIAWGLE